MEFPKFLRVAVLPIPHVVELDADAENRVVPTGGVEANIIHVLSKAMDFSYELLVPNDVEWGREPKGKPWTGMIGMLQRNEADIAIGHISITLHRTRAVDFIPYTVEANTFVTRMPKAILKASSYAMPFRWQLWAACFLMVIGMPVLYRFIMSKRVPLQKLTIEMIGCVFHQPLSFTTTSSRDKYLLGLWLTLTFFLSSSYTAVLLSSLTVPLREKGVKNIQELSLAVSKGMYKCYVNKGSADLELLMDSQDKNLRIIGEAVQANNWTYKMKNRAFPIEIGPNQAVLGPRSLFFLKYGEPHFTEMNIFKDTIASRTLGIAVSKDFCCKKPLAKYMSRIMNMGIFKKLVDNEAYSTRKKYAAHAIPKSTNQPLSLNDLSGVFFLLLGGWAFSCIICISDVLVQFYYYKTKGTDSNGVR